MKIEMPIKFHGNYKVIVREGDWETRERCQKLFVRELSPEQKEKYYGKPDKSDVPTCQVSFYDFGCRRIIEGQVKENTEDKLIIKVRDKEYEFSPFEPSH